MTIRKALSFCLSLSLFTGTGTLRAQPAPADPEVAKGMKLVDDGDYDSAILTLDNAARRLASEPAKVKELSQAYVYLGIAYVGKGHEAAAKAKFREALERIKDLTLSPDKFPPKVIDLFEAAKQEASKATPPPPEAKAGGGHKGLLIAGAVVVAGGAVALAAGGKGSSPMAAPTPTPIPLKTDTYGPITLTVAQFCQPTPFNVFVTANGTLTANLTWQENFALLSMGLFGDANSFSNGTNVLVQSNQTSNTSATLTFPVTAKQYFLGVCHSGNSCSNMNPCAATFTLTIQHP